MYAQSSLRKNSYLKSKVNVNEIKRLNMRPSLWRFAIVAVAQFIRERCLLERTAFNKYLRKLRGAFIGVDRLFDSGRLLD